VTTDLESLRDDVVWLREDYGSLNGSVQHNMGFHGDGMDEELAKANAVFDRIDSLIAEVTAMRATKDTHP